MAGHGPRARGVHARLRLPGEGARNCRGRPTRRSGQGPGTEACHQQITAPPTDLSPPFGQPSTLEGSWDRQATLQASHAFGATQAPDCRLRITVLNETAGEGHKVVLNSIMVASGVELANNSEELGALEAGRRRQRR